jgi:uncharacterized protein involved in exopolysaccharide biosynthesis
MRVTLFALSICSMCFLSGCGPARYRAAAAVYVESAPEHASAIDFPSEINAIKSLAKPLIPQGTELTVTQSKKDDIIMITVTSTDPAQAADICNRIAETYIAKTKEGVSKTLLEKAIAPSRPI